MSSSDPTPDSETLDALRRAGLLGSSETPRCERLTGGVSSDIWKIATSTRVYCVKRALSKLRVAADWQVSVERNRYEVAWLRAAADVLAEAVPRVLLHDEAATLCVMEYLDPARYLLWKSELRDGRADPEVAAEVGRRLARIHAATAGDTAVAARFPPNDIFHAIRLEPYLEASAERHPGLRDLLFELSRRTAATRVTMIHGDVSPKNILLGPRGPVFLDAECACIGDPAFDLAFCLNHLLLKCLWNRQARAGFLDSFAALARGYRGLVDWEPPDRLEQRAASLLPGLLLARVDGKSPVEYLTDPADQQTVRRVAGALLREPVTRLDDVAEAWREAIET